MNPTQGVLYIAAGQEYINAAIRAAGSVRKYCPGLPVHLFADWQNHPRFHFDRDPAPFTSVGNIPDPHPRSKVDYLPLSPFDRTLYLDTDTRLNADIREIFGLLDRFDIALVHEMRRNYPIHLRTWRTPLPLAFPQFNGGVILYRKTPPVIQFLEDWKKYYQQAGYPQDQVTLRELLWLSDLQIATLPPEYNVRFLKYHFLWSQSEAHTKIFHLQMYHDGPFWFLKNWGRRLGRTILLRLGLNPAKVKQIFKK